MPENNQATPEKQLLNLIEKPMAQSSLHAATIKYHGQSLFSPGAFKGRFAFLKNNLKNFFRPQDSRQFDIKAINQILKVCVLILSVYFAANLSISILGLKRDIKIKTFEPLSISEPNQIPSFLKQVSYYLEKARERDIFKMGVKKPEGSLVAVKGPSQKLTEATQSLKLVGISWSDDPDVMIEDTKNSRTYFLKKGQSLDDGIKLKAVFKDKVILGLEGEELELR